MISLLACLFSSLLNAQTCGTLSVSVATSSSGGNYAPRNILGIRIEDNSGKFVKTLLAYANTRKTHLNTWEASTTTAGSVFNSVVDITAQPKGIYLVSIITDQETVVRKIIKELLFPEVKISSELFCPDFGA